jgi:hypothetical protein
MDSSGRQLPGVVLSSEKRAAVPFFCFDPQIYFLGKKSFVGLERNFLAFLLAFRVRAESDQSWKSLAVSGFLRNRFEYCERLN